LIELNQHALVRLAAGGFSLSSGHHVTATVVPSDSGWIARGDGWSGAWRLDADSSAAAGILLRDEAGIELGRSLRASGTDEQSPCSQLLLGDGRLFHVRLCGPADARYELAGWETPGAYLVARPNADGWTIDETAAGSQIETVNAELLVLFAAEIIEAERRG